MTFFKINFSKKSSTDTIRVSNSLDSDQDPHYVGPDLGVNCLQRLSADDKGKPARVILVFIALSRNEGSGSSAHFAGAKHSLLTYIKYECK